MEKKGNGSRQKYWYKPLWICYLSSKKWKTQYNARGSGFPSSIHRTRVVPGFCKGFAVQPKLTAVICTQAQGMLLFPGFNFLPHISKAVGLILTLGITVLLASFLGWFLAETRRLQSYYCVEVFSCYPLNPGAKSTCQRAVTSQKYVSSCKCHEK